MPTAYGSIYSASKAAVNNLSISLWKELGPKQIRVNALNPGLVITEGLEAAGFMNGERYDTAGKSAPLGRAGQPDDIGKIAVFLASDESYWITGQLIHAAGGVTLSGRLRTKGNSREGSSVQRIWKPGSSARCRRG